MNKRGFTLIELLATLVVLGIIAGITIVTVNSSFTNTKRKTQDIFVNTLEDALIMYIDSDAKRIDYNSSSVCQVNKRFGTSHIYKNKSRLTFYDVMHSDYTPLVESEFVNPANEQSCNVNAPVFIYYDDDYVYYYKVDKRELGCLIIDDNNYYITNLPSGCDG